MSRTFRNRSTVPVGYCVYDGGFVASAQFPTKLDHRRAAGYFVRWLYTPTKFRRSYVCVEVGSVRKAHRQWYRHYANQLVRLDRSEEIVPDFKTGGWESW